jgi:hypothetical protein
MNLRALYQFACTKIEFLERESRPGHLRSDRRAARVAELDLDRGVDREAHVLGHLLALIPRQVAPQVGRQAGHLTRDRGAHVRGGSPCSARQV